MALGKGLGFDTGEINVSKPGLCSVLKVYMGFLGKIVEGMTEGICALPLPLFLGSYSSSLLPLPTMTENMECTQGLASLFLCTRRYCTQIWCLCMCNVRASRLLRLKADEAQQRPTV